MNNAEWKKQYALRPQMVWLQISSWRGMAIGATHWYGEMRNSEHTRAVRMMYPLTEEQALELTKKHNGGTLVEVDYAYQAGDEVSSFDTKEEIIAQAIATWRTEFPDRNVLVIGNPAYADEVPVILDGEYK